MIIVVLLPVCCGDAHVALVKRQRLVQANDCSNNFFVNHKLENRSVFILYFRQKLNPQPNMSQKYGAYVELLAGGGSDVSGPAPLK